MDIKPIQTEYNDHLFRSRLEARWAVFMDELDVKWEYEKEGYELPDGSRYLPDFWLQDYHRWIEVKGQQSESATTKAILLSAVTNNIVLICSQIPRIVDGEWYPSASAYWVEMRSQDQMETWYLETLYRMRSHPAEYIAKGIDPSIDPSFDTWLQRMMTFHPFAGIYIWVCHVVGDHWCECPDCHRINFGVYPCEHCGSNVNSDPMSPRIIKAFARARQARFEHGEHGR